MHTVEITLEQVLLARDRRVQRQQALHRQYGGTLLSFTMNIAGPVKDTPLVRLAFRAGLAALDRDLGAPVHRESVAAPTGPEALLVYHRPAGAVKDLCLRLVFDLFGNAVSGRCRKIAGSAGAAENTAPAAQRTVPAGTGHAPV